MNVLAAVCWLAGVLVLVLAMRIIIGAVQVALRWPRWKPTYQGAQMEAIHLGYHLLVDRHPSPAGPWQTWTWKVSEPDTRKDHAVYHAITIGAASTPQDAQLRAFACAESIAQHKRDTHTP